MLHICLGDIAFNVPMKVYVYIFIYVYICTSNIIVLNEGISMTWGRVEKQVHS